MNRNNNSGFTLVEVLVSTALFVTVVSAMLGLFNYTLKINRRVQALREVVQGTRTFAETITREIRNGRIDYDSWSYECNVEKYSTRGNTSLGLISKSGDRLCFFFSNDKMYLTKQTPSGESTSPIFDSANFTVVPGTFHFTISPTKDPNTAVNGQFPKLQPMVTIAGQFLINNGAGNSTTINYQTTISTDVYDTRK
jgi:prepilin-type N-terminal cleavage/methylation domain-containing protein